MERQTEIDWTRASQLALLRDMQLEPLRSADGTCVKPRVLMAVLRIIDDYGRGREAWLAYETLALRTGFGLRSVKRAVEVLEAASLLCVQLRRSVHGVVCNHYRIVWSELALKCPPPAVAQPIERRSGRVDVAAEVECERSAVATERSAVATPPQCRGDTQTVLPSMKRIEPPPPQPLQLIRTARSTSGPLGPDWLAAAAEFSSISKIRLLAAAAEASGEAVDAWRARVAAAMEIAEDARRRGVLHSVGGAVAYFLESGSWPADKVERTAVAPTKEREAADRQQSLDHAAFLAMTELRKLRQHGATYEHAVEQLRAKYPAAVCARNGW